MWYAQNKGGDFMDIEARKLIAGISLMFGIVMIMPIVLSPDAPFIIRVIAICLGASALLAVGIIKFVFRKRGKNGK